MAYIQRGSGNLVSSFSESNEPHVDINKCWEWYGEHQYCPNNGLTYWFRTMAVMQNITSMVYCRCCACVGALNLSPNPFHIGSRKVYPPTKALPRPLKVV